MYKYAMVYCTMLHYTRNYACKQTLQVLYWLDGNQSRILIKSPETPTNKKPNDQESE